MFDPGPLPPQTALSGERWGPSSRRSPSARRGDPIRRSFLATRLPPQTVLSGEPSFSWAHMVVAATILQTGEGMGSSRRRPLALSCRTDGPKQLPRLCRAQRLYLWRDRRNFFAEVLTAVGNSQPEGNLVRRLEISLIRREDRPATATRATPACETFNSSIRAARPMETQPEASVGAAQADRRQLVPPAPGATAFKRGRPVTLLHQTGQGKNTVAQIHAGGATPPRRSPSVGETATPVTERSWECLRLAPGRSLLLRLFVSSILHLSEDPRRPWMCDY